MNNGHTRLAETLLDRYRIERELGAGGMATVYLAHDLKHDRKVAIKVLKPELAAVLGAERFLAEIRTTANLQHPHILPLFDSGTADSFLYYVMPFVEGESLRERLDREGELPVEEAVRIATAIANALDNAHRHGVIHRDIKPANILLHDGQPVVADFGIALAVSAAGGGRLTETGLSLGTPYYMSPEQATAERDPDPRSDVYALGCVLYEMLVGEPPYTGASAQAVLGKILTTDPVRPTEHRRAIPDHVEAAVLKALEKRPADRFGGAEQFGEALTHPAMTLASREPQRNAMKRLRGWRLAAVGLGVASIGLAGLLSWGWVVNERGHREDIIQFLPLAITDPPRGAYLTGSGVELSPDGQRVVYWGADGGWWLLDLARGHEASVPLGSALHVNFSPTGDSLAWTTSAWLQQMFVRDLATGRETQLTDSAQGEPEWEMDGWIYYRDQLGGLRRVHVNDGLRETLVQPGPEEPWYAVNPTLIPGGRAVLFTRVPLGPRNPSGAEIVLLKVDTKEMTVIETGVEAAVTSSGHLIILKGDGTLFATRFDSRSLEIRGQPAPVLRGLEVRELWEVGGSFSIGDDGSFLYVEARPMVDDTVVIVGRNGEPRRDTQTWGGAVSRVAYDQGEERWVAVVNPGLVVANIFARARGGGEPRRLTFGEVLDQHPQFIPNTRDVAFVSPREGKNWDLYRVPFDGSGPAEFILDRPGDIFSPRFTPDGLWVVFCEADHLGQRDVVAHRLRPDSTTVVLVATEAQECYPDISPDGRWLAYESDETGRAEVWVRPFDDSIPARWQVSREGGTGAKWSISGGELFYLNARGELMSVPVLEGGSFSFGSPTVLFALDEHSVWTRETALRDEEFILIRSMRAAVGRVILIRNFSELIRRTVGQ